MEGCTLDLERRLLSVESSARKDNEWADVMLKLVNIAGDVYTDSTKSNDFLSMVCRLLVREEPSISGDDNDTEVFRDYIMAVCIVLKKAIRPALENGKCESILSIGMVDLLRTSAFCLSQSDTDREYTQYLRTGEGRQKGELWHLIRSPKVLPEIHEAYATAEAMFTNFKLGVDALEELASRGDDYLLEFIKTASKGLCACMECMAVPAMLDGQRLLAGNAIAAKLFGSGEGGYGSDFVAKFALNANSTMLSLQRIHLTICSFLAMSQVETSLGHRLHAHTLLKDISRCLERRDTTSDSRADTPSGLCATLSQFATWFEEAVHDDSAYTLVRGAFENKVLVLGDGASEDLREHWDELCQHCPYAAKGIGVWTAVEILCTLHQSKTGLALPFNAALLAILSGIVGNATLGHKINGPFVLNGETKVLAASYYNLLPKRYTLGLQNIPSDSKNDPVRTGTRPCRKTAIINALIDRGSVRGQHEKGRLPEARLKVSLTMCGWKETLLRVLKDISSSVSASPSEGNKNLRRIYMIAMQTLPGVNNLFDEDQHSFLIEKSRRSDDGLTTADNVEKPWRDVACGGSVIQTLLFPVASRAFMATLLNMEDATDTNTCVCDFSKRLDKWSNHVFDTSDVTEESMYKDGVEYVDTIFSQQRAFVHSFCNVIHGLGALWESCNLTFSVHTPKDCDDLDDAPPMTVSPPAAQCDVDNDLVEEDYDSPVMCD